MRVASYRRISTDEINQPFSLGAQGERLHAYAKSQDGWSIVREFHDDASGFTLERADFKQMLAEAEAGVFDVVLVWKIDRLSRRLSHLSQIAEQLDGYGVALRSVTEPFDTSTPAGKMMMQMLGVFAEFERAMIIERIRAGMERGASQGRWVVGKVPFGYLRDKESKLIFPEPSQSEVIRRIFSLYTEKNLGAQAIATKLNDAGYRTKNGVLFAAPIVLDILNNPIYVGLVRYRDKVHKGLHEPIIDPETFEAASAILAERGESQALRRSHPADYLLSGVLRCGHCNKAFVGTAAHGRSKTYHYYTCSTRYRYGTSTCDAERLNKGELEQLVFEQIAEIYQDGSLVAEAIADLGTEKKQTSDDAERRLAGIRQDRAAAERSLDRYFAAFEEGTLSPADCQKRIRALRERIDKLDAEEVSLQRANSEPLEATSAADVIEWAQDLPTLLTAGTPQQQKALIRKLVRELRVLSPGEIVPTYKIPALVRAPSGQVEGRGHYSNLSDLRKLLKNLSDERKWGR